MKNMHFHNDLPKKFHDKFVHMPKRQKSLYVMSRFSTKVNGACFCGQNESLNVNKIN